jgi:hypothetical protein
VACGGVARRGAACALVALGTGACALGGLGVAACDAGGRANTLTLTGATDADREVRVGLEGPATVDLDATALGALDRDVGAARLRGRTGERVFLLTEDLASGVTGGEAFVLPVAAQDQDVVDVALAPEDARRIRSVRVVDTGTCATFLPWPRVEALAADALRRALLTGDVEAGLGGPAAPAFAVAEVDVPSTRVVPTLRASPSDAGDTLRVLATLRLGRVERAATPAAPGARCAGVEAELDFTVRPALVPARAPLQRCPPGVRTGAAFATAERGPRDVDAAFVGRASVVAHLGPGGRCDPDLPLGDASGGAPSVEAVVRAALEARFSRALDAAIARVGAVSHEAVIATDPELLAGAATLECACDAQCASFLGSSFAPSADQRAAMRSVCVEREGGRGQCALRIEAHRLAVRPDGLALVSAEVEGQGPVETLDRYFDLAHARDLAGCRDGTPAPDERVGAGGAPARLDLPRP